MARPPLDAIACYTSCQPRHALKSPIVSRSQGAIIPASLDPCYEIRRHLWICRLSSLRDGLFLTSLLAADLQNFQDSDAWASRWRLHAGAILLSVVTEDEGLDEVQDTAFWKIKPVGYQYSKTSLRNFCGKLYSERNSQSLFRRVLVGRQLRVLIVRDVCGRFAHTHNEAMQGYPNQLRAGLASSVSNILYSSLKFKEPPPFHGVRGDSKISSPKLSHICRNWIRAPSLTSS